MYRFILFDLDGTLTDPKEGICKSVQHALQKAGIEAPEIDKLTPFIGPPLRDSFREFYHMDDAQTEQAVTDYRERFAKVGWKENIPYPGVDRMLAHCRQQGARLAVASSKPQEFVEKILKHFGMYKYFDVIVGSEPDGRRSKKEEIVKETLEQLYGRYGKKMPDAQRREQTAMVGDRKFDIEGARSEGVDGIGVSYGYAEKGELAKAGADAIAGSVEELEELLLGGKKPGNSEPVRIKPVPDNSFLKAVYMLAPFAVWFLLNQVISLLGVSIVDLLKQSKDPRTMAWAEANLQMIQLWARVLINAGTVVALYFFYRNWEPFPWKPKTSLSKSRRTIRSLQIAGLGAFFSLGLNILINQLVMALAPYFVNEEQLAEMMGKAGYDSQTPLVVGTLLFVVASPLMEELIFRWLLYNRISRVFAPVVSVVLTAVFFGFFHGNLLQGGYAFLMGLLLAWLRVGEECVSAPYLFHAAANAVIFWLGFLPKRAQELVGHPYLSLVYLVIGFVFYKILSKSAANICA